MYTEICAELGATIAVVSSAPYIQFSLILYLPLEGWAICVFPAWEHHYSVSISRGKVTGVIDLNRRRPKPIPLGASGFQRDGFNQGGKSDGKEERPLPMEECYDESSGNHRPIVRPFPASLHVGSPQGMLRRPRDWTRTH